jgi:hypothetical protein
MEMFGEIPCYKMKNFPNTFGDKHALFLEALKRYEQQNSVSTIDILEGPAWIGKRGY